MQLIKHSVGIVLAGGRSTRMGRDKALLSFRGRRLIDHMVDIMARSGVETVAVSGSYPGLPCIEDRVFNRGPVGGLHSVLATGLSLGTAILVVPVDMPNLNPSLLNRLLIELYDTNSHAIQIEGYEMPSAYIVSELLKKNIEELIMGANPSLCSMRVLLEKMHATSLSLSQQNREAFNNINFPAEWLRFEQDLK